MSRNLKRDQRILQLRADGLRGVDVARMFRLSPSRIRLIEMKAADDRAMAERRSKLLEEMRAANDHQKLWPVKDLVDVLGLSVVTRKRLLDHFAQAGTVQISLRELMDMCMDGSAKAGEPAMPPLLGVYGIGHLGFWSVVDGLTKTDLGCRANEEWSQRLALVKKGKR